MAEEEQLDIFRNLPSLSSTCFAGRITKQFPSISVADAKGNYLSKTKKHLKPLPGVCVALQVLLDIPKEVMLGQEQRST